MTPIFTVLEKYWYIAVLTLATYLFIILIIELKDLKYLHFNFRLKKHEYKETKSWTRLNQLFLREFKFYKDIPFSDLIAKVHQQFRQLIIISNQISDEGSENAKLQRFIENVSHEDVKIFLMDPFKWLNWISGTNGSRFLEKTFKKKKKSLKKLLPYLIDLEKHFLLELHFLWNV